MTFKWNHDDETVIEPSGRCGGTEKNGRFAILEINASFLFHAAGLG
jgi:hypothetical protein